MSNCTALVPFQGTPIPTVSQDDEVFVAMKPVVEGMGLAWQSQAQKLVTQRKKWGCHDIVIPSAGGPQEMLCIPLKKLNGWLFSINPEKVRAAIRETVLRYQEECFTALHDYWFHGVAVREGGAELPGCAHSPRAHALEPVPFAGDTLWLLWHEGKAHIPLVPILKGMDLWMGSQYDRLRKGFGLYVADVPLPELSPVGDDWPQALAAANKRTVFCLNLEGLEWWLATMKPRRATPPEKLAKIRLYRSKVAAVLRATIERAPTARELPPTEPGVRRGPAALVHFPREMALPPEPYAGFTYNLLRKEGKWASPTRAMLAELQDLGCDVAAVALEQDAKDALLDHLHFALLDRMADDFANSTYGLPFDGAEEPAGRVRRSRAPYRKALAPPRKVVNGD